MSSLHLQVPRGGAVGTELGGAQALEGRGDPTAAATSGGEGCGRGLPHFRFQLPCLESWLSVGAFLKSMFPS